ncbi:hypothetical protein B296_00006942 [Ensete ventricosum]|uniref:Uncharacterized protein n=1 Tax=Ensete ventricosum TaxID=4639 RepID=A0A427B2L8_ENSVE|nr:hypothetical protein B296_00006942 [Ensete ventricosum]
MRLRAILVAGGEEETRRVRHGAAVVVVDDSGCDCDGSSSRRQMGTGEERGTDDWQQRQGWQGRATDER